MPSKILDNYKKVIETINSTAIKSGRNPEEITLVAVSKNHPVEKIKPLIDKFNHKHFGENRVQELLFKYPQIPTAKWHLIGHLQTNKVNKLLREAKPFLIHSLDRTKLAQKINTQAGKLNINVPCLIEVKISEDATKHGVLPAETRQLVENIIQNFPHISLKGFMGMATYTTDTTVIRQQFRKLVKIREELSDLSSEKHPLTELSMGMSNDYPIAIEEGATIIRVGSAIFSE